RKPIATPRPLTGRAVLFCLIAFFGTVIGVNMLMMKLAIDTLPGTEVDSAYRASLAYKNEIQAADEQNRRSWKVEAHVERRADGAATVRL
ncbi:FixH family protein, partial [Acinetobacter baumannii]